MRYLNFFLILLQVVLNSSAQVFIKSGVKLLDFNQPLLPLFLSVVSNLYIFLGATILIASLSLWIYLLSQYDLSFLYPITSLGFVMTAVIGWLFFSETISLSRGIGIFFILLGVMFIAKN